MISTRLLTIVPLSVALLSACVIAPYPARRVVYSQPVPANSQPGYSQPGYSQAVPVEGDDVVVDMAPPVPYVEVVPVIPFAGAIWLGGYWGWNGGRHQWFPGRWEHARPGYGWRSPAWAQQGGRWHFHGGGWVRH